MSQTDTDATTGEQSDSTDDSPSLRERVTAVRERLDSADTDEIRDMDDLSLVELRTELKELEDTVEDVRKDVADEELTDRMEPGENLYGLTLIESHNKYLKEDEAEVIMRAVSQGISYTDFVSVNASKLAEQHPELAEIGRAEYTYLR